MKTFIGIDLGSTTTKAVVMDEARTVLGRGITNSRSNYDTAAAIAKQEALVAARFFLFREELSRRNVLEGALEAFLAQLERDFRLEQYLEQLADLEQVCARNVQSAKFGDAASGVASALEKLFSLLKTEAPALFAPGAKRKSDFFRDIAGAQYLALGEQVPRDERAVEPLGVGELLDDPGVVVGQRPDDDLIVLRLHSSAPVTASMNRTRSPI